MQSGSKGHNAGSPPHTWGIPHGFVSRERSPRFTPTHVGNTFQRSIAYSKRPVHPHTRGEYYIYVPCFQISDGSPPHTWGIRVPKQNSLREPRFTPTHVGNTGFLTRYSHNSAGSPPHTWGIQEDLSDCRLVTRFTPTHVGNTQPDKSDYSK